MTTFVLSRWERTTLTTTAKPTTALATAESTRWATLATLTTSLIKPAFTTFTGRLTFCSRSLRAAIAMWRTVAATFATEWRTATFVPAILLTVRPAFLLSAFGAWRNHRQRYTLTLHIDSHDPNGHNITHRDNVVRALDELVG